MLDETEPSLTGDIAPASDPLTRFRIQLTRVGGECVVVADEVEAANAIACVLQRVGARRVAVSDAPIIRRLLEATPGPCDWRPVDQLSRDDLFDCDAGLTTAQWGIAETGTLVLESAHERSRLTSLLPPVHIALLPAHRIRDTLGEVLAALQNEGAAAAVDSRAITFITGPSRTSDIELTLTIGVHGPTVVHVIVLEHTTDGTRTFPRSTITHPPGIHP